MAKHWIFDLDGTLIDSHPLYRSVFEEVARHFRLDLSAQAWEELCHIVLPAFLDKYFPSDLHETALKMVVDRNVERQLEIEVYDGIFEILDHLQGAGCVMSVCTARELKSAKAILAAKNLEKYFGRLISRDCVTQTKPHPEGVLRLISESGAAVHETLMVGDHIMDIEAARGAGILAVGVGWNTYAREDLSPHSDHHFRHIGDFHKWVVSKVSQIS